MKTRFLLAAAAIPAFMFSTAAMAEPESGNFSVSYSNNITTNLSTSQSFYTDLDLDGDININGNIYADSAAAAVNDVKQIQDGSFVSNGSQLHEDGMDANNTVNRFSVTGAGNVGVNAAAGYLNDQMNSTSIAVSADNRARTAGRAGGSSTASATALQYLNEVTFSNASSNEGESRPSATNTVNMGDVGGSGNIGVNAAAGSLNQQANLLTLAVANDSVLSNASAGLVQTAFDPRICDQNGNNTVNSGNIGTGSSGNIGVNLAAGVGNQQLNSLTIATSSATGGSGGSGEGS